MGDRTTSSRIYRGLGRVVIAVAVVCAALAGLIASPWADAHDDLLAQIAVAVGLLGGLVLFVYMAWTLTVVMAGRVWGSKD